MHRASCGFMPLCGITETLSDVESVRVVHGLNFCDINSSICHYAFICRDIYDLSNQNAIFEALYFTLKSNRKLVN